MTDWKTKLAGFSTILTGIGMIIAALTKEGGFNFADIQAGIVTVTGGLAVLGLGHKAQKIIDKIQ